MKKDSVILGQLSLWDIEIPKVEIKAEKVEKIIKEESVIKIENKSKGLEITVEQKDFLNKNNIMENDNLTRVVLSCGGGLRIELLEGLEYKTLYVNGEGKKEFTINGRVNPTPMCKIIYFTEDIELNDIQKEKLEEIKSEALRVIKRKGDGSVILETPELVKSINNLGWILEWHNIQAIYNQDEVINTPSETESEEIEVCEDTREITVGDTVEVKYQGVQHQGQVVRRYGPGECTVNVKFDGKHTAFYVGAVKKIA